MPDISHFNAKYIRIPIVQRMDLNNPFPAPAIKLYELILDSKNLANEVQRAISKSHYRRSADMTGGVVILGKDIIEQVSNFRGDEIQDLYLDLSEDIIISDYGIMLDSDILGTSVIRTPKLLQARQPLDQQLGRHYLTSLHIESAIKLAADNGLVHQGEYKDGYYSAIRDMCELLGSKLPYPFIFTKRPSPPLISELVDRIYRETSGK